MFRSEIKYSYWQLIMSCLFMVKVSFASYSHHHSILSCHMSCHKEEMTSEGAVSKAETKGGKKALSMVFSGWMKVGL